MPLYKNNVLFIHIPKTSGTYIEKQLKNYEIGNNFGYVNSMSTYKQHLTFMQYKELYGDIFNNSLIFTIIRNPYDRLYSAYKQRYKSSSDPYLIDMMKSDNFEDFVLNKLEKILHNGNTHKGNITHILPQSNFIQHCMNYVKIIKYENLNSLSTILKDNDLNVDIIFNNTNDNYICNYNDLMINKIQMLYKSDIELYNSL